MVTPLVPVPRVWPGATVVCFASGPSLTREDAEYVRSKAYTIAINDAVTLAPWADVLYSSDNYWYVRQQGVKTFQGMKYAMSPRRNVLHNPFARWPEIQVLANTGETGLELEPTGLRTGRNSGYAAINLAVHFGASRIVLLGYDMSLGPKGEAHFDGKVGSGPGHYHLFRESFRTLVGPLKAVGVTVINCSRRTALTAFPRGELRTVLQSSCEAVA